jgi:hypothetical protein
MRLDGRQTLASFCAGRQQEAQFFDGFIQDRLQPSQIRVFIANNGVFIDRPVTPFNFGIIGGAARANQEMGDPQAL